MFEFESLSQDQRVVLVSSIINANKYIMGEKDREEWVRKYIDGKMYRTVKTSEDFVNSYFDHLNGL